MTLEGLLPVLAGLIAFSALNVSIAAILLRRKAPVQGQRVSFQTILELLALSLLLIVLMAALLIDVQLITPAIPALGRPLMYVFGALLTFVARRIFLSLPDTPQWMLRIITGLQLLLIVLALVSLVLGLAIRAA